MNVGSLPLKPNMWISFKIPYLQEVSLWFFQIENHSDYMSLLNKGITNESFQSKLSMVLWSDLKPDWNRVM